MTEERTLVGGGVEAMKGVYQSIRLAEVMRLFYVSARYSLLIQSSGKTPCGQCRRFKLVLLAPGQLRWTCIQSLRREESDGLSI